MTARSLALTLLLSSLGVLAACKHVPTDKEKQTSEIHYDLGIHAQNAGNMQEAYAEYMQALEMDDTNSRAHHALGLLLHLAFGRHQEALPHFERAIELDPEFAEARVNLGNLHLDLKQYDKAIENYELALNDMRYSTPFIAQGNLGMAEYRRGNVEKGIDHIKSAITVNPKFCLGHRNLGSIYDETGKTEEACTQFARYREACPDAADAYYREAVCVAKLGQSQQARDLFAQCEAKAPAGQLKDDCQRLGAQLQ